MVTSHKRLKKLKVILLQIFFIFALPVHMRANEYFVEKFSNNVIQLTVKHLNEAGDENSREACFGFVI